MSETANDDPWSPASNPEAIAISEAQWWIWALDLCAGRIRTGRGRVQQIDARQFVVALRQVRYAAQMQQQVITRLDVRVRKALGSAVSRFDASLPSHVLLRDALIHFADHARGEGIQQRRTRKATGIDAFEAARQSWGGGYESASGEFTLGSHRINVENAREAAHDLFDAIYIAGKAVDESKTS